VRFHTPNSFCRTVVFIFLFAVIFFVKSSSYVCAEIFSSPDAEEDADFSLFDHDDSSPATMENLLVNAMRQSPHWIGPGELRTPEEFATALRAAQTGHYFFSTLHAEGDKKAVLRFLTAYLMVSNEPAELALRNICNAIKFIIYVEKLADGSRKITSISEVTGSSGLEPLVNKIYTFEFEDVEENEKTHEVIRILGRHKRVGCISREAQEQMLKSGIKRSRFDFLVNPPQDNETEVYV